MIGIILLSLVGIEFLESHIQFYNTFETYWTWEIWAQLINELYRLFGQFSSSYVVVLQGVTQKMQFTNMRKFFYYFLFVLSQFVCDWFWLPDSDDVMSLHLTSPNGYFIVYFLLSSIWRLNPQTMTPTLSLMCLNVWLCEIKEFFVASSSDSTALAVKKYWKRLSISKTKLLFFNYHFSGFSI